MVGLMISKTVWIGQEARTDNKSFSNWAHTHPKTKYTCEKRTKCVDNKWKSAQKCKCQAFHTFTVSDIQLPLSLSSQILLKLRDVLNANLYRLRNYLQQCLNFTDSHRHTYTRTYTYIYVYTHTHTHTIFLTFSPRPRLI